MGIFSSNRKNVSIYNISPILADILILDMRGILSHYSDYPEERYLRHIKRALEKHPEYEVSDRHIKRLSTMMTNFINDLQKTELIRDLFIHVGRMLEEEKVDGMLNEVFSSKAEFMEKWRNDMIILIEGRMSELDL